MDLLTALDNRSQEDVVGTMEILTRNRSLVNSLAVRLNDITQRIERQIAFADPEDCDRLRQLWLNRVTPEVISRQDFDTVREVADQIFKESQKNLDEEVAQAQKDLAWKDAKVSALETTQWAVDKTLMVGSMVVPGGTELDVSYNLLSGWAEGSFYEGAKKAAENYNAATRIINSATGKPGTPYFPSCNIRIMGILPGNRSRLNRLSCANIASGGKRLC